MYEKLAENIISVIEEEQIKLGYDYSTVGLYYPLKSLNAFLGETLKEEEMQKKLEKFAKEYEKVLFIGEITRKKDRFCIPITGDGQKYIHEHMKPDNFLAQLVNLILDHTKTIEDVISLFKAFSKNVHVEKVDNGEFEYLIYFENQVPDAFYYCFDNFQGHLSYHRYTKNDYLDFGF